MSDLTVLPGRRAIVRDLPSFLAHHGTEVRDVGRGIAPGTRRLLVGRPGVPEPSHVIAVVNEGAFEPAIDRESRHLSELAGRLRPSALPSVPTVIGRIDVSGLPGLALTAVPGLGRPVTQRLLRTLGEETSAVLQWLRMLWQDTSGVSAGVAVGREAVDELVSRYAGVAGVADTLGAVHRARTGLGAFATPRTVSHGCLCHAHVFVTDDVVTGVEDWSGSEIQSDPLRDLGSWLVRSVGARLSDVVAARTARDRVLRDFVVDGLAVWGIPSRCWRDVLLLTQAEIAVERLRLGDFAGMDLLTEVSCALPGSPGKNRSST
jgi:hypothetical protein